MGWYMRSLSFRSLPHCFSPLHSSPRIHLQVMPRTAEYGTCKQNPYTAVGILSSAYYGASMAVAVLSLPSVPPCGLLSSPRTPATSPSRDYPALRPRFATPPKSRGCSCTQTKKESASASTAYYPPIKLNCMHYLHYGIMF